MKTKKITVSKIFILLIALIFYSGEALVAQCGWIPVFADTSAMFGSGGIFFTNANTGYTVGAKTINNQMYPWVRKTTNAGSNWYSLTTPLIDSSNFYFRYVCFTDVNTGYITAAQLSPLTDNGKILKTTDAGNTWSVYTPSVNKHMTCICFVNGNTGYASGYHTILKTTNAGTTWEPSFENGSGYLFGIYFTDVNTGYVVGNNGFIYKSTNGGNTWTLTQPTEKHLWGLWFTDANTGFAVGGNDVSPNIILRTTNAGNNWDSVQHQPSNGLLYSVRFVNSVTGFITGDYAQVFKTTNGGLNWYRQYLQVPDSSNYWPAGTFFTSASTGYIAGGFYSPRIASILKTTTGGEPVGIEPISNEVPAQFQLHQNYPNPFNPRTEISFGLPKESFVTLVIYDVLGREIAVLVNEKLKPGTYEVDFDGTNYPSGVYFYRLETESFRDVKKMILVK